MQSNPLSPDINHQVQVDFPDKTAFIEVLEILTKLYEDNKNYGPMIQAIRGLVYIAKGDVEIIRSYCVPHLQHDPRDVIMEAEHLAGNPGHWFGIPFDQMESFSGELPETTPSEDDGLPF